MKGTASARKPEAKHFLFLAAVLALGAGLRFGNITDSADSPFFNRPVIDGQAYDTMALAIRDGTLRQAPFYQDPLYPYFLAATYEVFGHRYWPVYVIQALLGCIVILLVWDMARLLFDWRAGVLAGLLVAGYRTLIFYEGVIDKTALSVFLTALFLWLAVRSSKSRHPAWPLLGGVALGLAALTRANLLVFAPFLALGYIFARRQVKPETAPRATRTGAGFARAGIALAGLALVIAPVSIRNSVIAREFVLTTTQAGQNFYIGNSEYNRTGQYEAPPWVRANPRFEETDFNSYADKAAGRKLGYAEASEFYFRTAYNWMKSSPAGFLKLLLRKAVLYLNNFEVPDSYDLAFLSRYSFVLRLPLFGFGIAFAFGMAGIFLFFRRSIAHLGLAIFFVVFSATVVAFFVLDRYRLPAVAALTPFAGAMPLWLWDRLRRKRYRGFSGGLVLCAGCLALTLYPLQGPGKTTQAQSLVNLGSRFLEEGDTSRALNAFNDALALQPGLPGALRNLGILRLRRGDQAQALADLQAAERSDPTDPFTRYYLGIAYEARNELEAALAEYRKSVDLSPSELKFRFGLGTALQKLGRYSSALDQYDTLLVLAPENPAVLHNRSVALYHLGRYREAAAALDEARRLGGPVNPNFERLLREKLAESR